MGGATTRFFTLLSSPLPLLHPRRPSSLLLLRLRHLTSHRASFHSPAPSILSPPNCSQSKQLHTHQAPQPLNSTGFSTPISSDYRHPWVEFTGFVTQVSQSGYWNAPLDAHHFVGAQHLDEIFLRVASLCLAFANDHPTLLWSLPREDIEVVVENGSPFLFTNGSATEARMKSFLGDGNNVSESEKPSTVDLVEYLLSYAHMAIGFSEDLQIESRVQSSVKKLFSELAKFKGSSMESVATVKKQFSERSEQAPMSFGKDVEMKKGDWICRSCSFMNFAKNSQCYQCQEHRPKKFITGGEWECPQCDFFNFGRNVVCLRCDCKKPAFDRFLSPTSISGLRADTFSVKNNDTEKTKEEQEWFTKIAQLEKSSDMSSALADEDLPETMKAGDHRFTRSAAGTGNLGTVDNPGYSYLQTAGDENSFNEEINRSLAELAGEKFVGGEFGNSSRTSSTSAMSTSDSSQYEQHNEPVSGIDTAAPAQQQMSDEKSQSLLQINDYDREQAEKSERWFKKVAELHDVKDLPSAISDDEFPEIMPMRKGENRFVVSKKKDRSLTSPLYKRRVAMEQASNNNYVPFVPFPPGYFAKDKSQEGSESTHPNEKTGAMRSDSGGVGERTEDKFSNRDFEASNNVDQNPKSIDFQFSSPSGYSKPQSTSENASAKDSWRERSLEGSAVKEPDPLDMSEEAKAERWFRRVSQIKDISELSQIPDEDFPSIMPMRKGVNRFVVSKRKTPLERRLTSSQYRRNLPVVSSDPERKETDSN